MLSEPADLSTSMATRVMTSAHAILKRMSLSPSPASTACSALLAVAVMCVERSFSSSLFRAELPRPAPPPPPSTVRLGPPPAAAAAAAAEELELLLELLLLELLLLVLLLLELLVLALESTSPAARRVDARVPARLPASCSPAFERSMKRRARAAAPRTLASGAAMLTLSSRRTASEAAACAAMAAMPRPSSFSRTCSPTASAT